MANQFTSASLREAKSKASYAADAVQPSLFDIPSVIDRLVLFLDKHNFVLAKKNVRRGGNNIFVPALASDMRDQSDRMFFPILLDREYYIIDFCEATLEGLPDVDASLLVALHVRIFTNAAGGIRAVTLWTCPLHDSVNQLSLPPLTRERVTELASALSVDPAGFTFDGCAAAALLARADYTLPVAIESVDSASQGVRDEVPPALSARAPPPPTSRPSYAFGREAAELLSCQHAWPEDDDEDVACLWRCGATRPERPLPAAAAGPGASSGLPARTAPPRLRRT